MDEGADSPAQAGEMQIQSLKDDVREAFRELGNADQPRQDSPNVNAAE